MLISLRVLSRRSRLSRREPCYRGKFTASVFEAPTPESFSRSFAGEHLQLPPSAPVASGRAYRRRRGDEIEHRVQGGDHWISHWCDQMHGGSLSRCLMRIHERSLCCLQKGMTDAGVGAPQRSRGSLAVRETGRVPGGDAEDARGNQYQSGGELAGAVGSTGRLQQAFPARLRRQDVARAPEAWSSATVR